MTWELILKNWTEDDIGETEWIETIKEKLNATHTGHGVFTFKWGGKEHHFNMHYLKNPPDTYINGWGKLNLIADPIKMADKILHVVNKHMDLQQKVGE